MPIQILEEAKDSITSLQISQYEIVSGCTDGNIRTHDIRMGTLLTDLISRKSFYDVTVKMLKNHFMGLTILILQRSGYDSNLSRNSLCQRLFIEMSSVSRLPSRLPTTGHSEITTSQKSLTIPTSQKSSTIRTNLKPPSTVSKQASSFIPSQSSTNDEESSQPSHTPYDPLGTSKLTSNPNVKSNPSTRTLFNLKKSNSLSVRSGNTPSTEMDNLRTENSQLCLELERLRAEQAKILAENEKLKAEKIELLQEKERDRAQYRNELEVANNLIIEQSTTMTEQQTLIEELMAQLDEQEQVCQDLHNMIDTFKAKQNLSSKEVENKPKVQITKDDYSTVQV
ncbi:11826_t:CDS:2 [Racocetra fulgida]|uniref:11826_t:CDS:1 n=1 Tax=Racocetra fulgida TaxID=60492 RepID=A0A9N9BKQ8_9GLOM|nr:11826_t:CDS:2 [Racocetra fulgida]